MTGFPTFYFGLENAVIKNGINPYRGEPTGLTDNPIGTSDLGTPYYSDLTIKGGSYTDNNGKTLQYPGLQLVTVVMTVNQAKNIITTSIQGMDGTVKEYIGMGDYEVTINGIITPTQQVGTTNVPANGVYPKNDVTTLKKILDAPVALEVTSWYLQMLGIYNLVVKDYNIPQIQGGYSQQPFTIRALSDKPIEILISNA
ncbi:MAG TPA: DUF6046 domain-containing protein [Candidatus Babeliaceae bacterium]|nr:DUF6046 domain-containing protein [Candidatus Babeliaceae bacterium]